MNKILFLSSVILGIVLVILLLTTFSSNADARTTIGEYCKYSVKNQLPTPWDYRCYDDPFGNPQREMDLEESAIKDDYRSCNLKDQMTCFEYSLEICRPSYFSHYQKTGEGDPIYYSVFLKEDCTIHVIFDPRYDMYSSIEDRRLYHTVCPDIELRDDYIILDSCKELEPFNGNYESFRIVKERSEIPVEDVCGPNTALVDGICHAVITETTGSDAPFFGIFVYLNNFISWIIGK